MKPNRGNMETVWLSGYFKGVKYNKSGMLFFISSVKQLSNLTKS
jgi:hypothetical protein